MRTRGAFGYDGEDSSEPMEDRRYLPPDGPCPEGSKASRMFRPIHVLNGPLRRENFRGNHGPHEASKGFSLAPPGVTGPL